MAGKIKGRKSIVKLYFVRNIHIKVELQTRLLIGSI